MNKKFFFGLLIFSLAVQIGLHFYLSNKKTTGKNEHEQELLQQALNLEVKFAQGHHHKQETTKVHTPYASMAFNNHGATLSDFTYNRTVDGRYQEFTILSGAEVITQPCEEQAFLVALDDRTPYAYKCKGVTEQDAGYTVSYISEEAEATIIKEFFVHKKCAQIDLALTVKPHHPTKVRLMWPSPLLKGLGEDEVVDGFMILGKNTFKKIAQKNINHEAFFMPTLFGVENKYFVFSLTNDLNNFTKRAYFKDLDNRLLAILESELIETEKTWNVSMYLGPKQAAAMECVDKRLTKVFDYGFFAFITRPLLSLLRLINDYIPNYGLAIILATLLLKLLLLPITWSGPRKMKRLEEYQRKMAYLEKKHQGDKKALEAARAELLQKDGVPLGGCLPLLIQLPFFMALQSGLNNSFELYRAPFVLWINDLSVADPYYVLPILTLIFMLTGGLIGQKGGGIRQNIASLIMMLVFFAFTSNLAAGLCLFILANVILQGLQTWLQKKWGNDKELIVHGR